MVRTLLSIIRGDARHSAPGGIDGTIRKGWRSERGTLPARLGVKKMIFSDREDAGRQLATRLSQYANQPDVVVLGVPRGGVPVAFEISKALHAPLDVFLSRKLGVPGREELAFGAIAAGDGRFLDAEIIERAGISAEQIERITQLTEKKLKQRALLYRDGRPPVQIEGRTIILVDDGIATGSSIYAAIHALRRMHPVKLVVAVPVAPSSTCDWLKHEVDELVCLEIAERFNAVGQFYRSFSQVSDEEVIALLQRPAAKVQERQDDPPDISSSQRRVWDGRQREITIDVGKLSLNGTLTIPKDPKGIVLFAHGSGSSRHSPRNRYVAEALQSSQIGTLLFDLLTPQEELADRWTADLRFNIGLLAARLTSATRWLIEQPETEHLGTGYFGASTGAAAALMAAAQLPDRIEAVVSRGGRPDLAAASLSHVSAPTLFIVGELDEPVASFNRQALAKLKCRRKQLVIIPGATHLFEEAGALEQVARVATEWFAHYLISSEGKSEMAAVKNAEAS